MLWGIFEKNDTENKKQKLEKKILESNFWKDKLSAQKILKEKKYLQDIYDGYNYISNELENLEELVDLA